jgi:hypothetical protein
MSMRNVLAILEDREDRLWSTFDAAVALADREHARLTLAKTRESGRVYILFSPYAVQDLYLPPDSDPAVAAGRLLARAAEFVPGDIPVTTLVLGSDTRRQLSRLVRSGAFDAVVGVDSLFRRAHRLGRELRRQGVAVIPIRPEPGHDPSKRIQTPAIEAPL